MCEPPVARPIRSKPPPNADTQVLRGENATPGWLRALYQRSGGAVVNRNGSRNAARAKRDAQLEALVDDGESYGWPDGPDVVVWNSGLHDMGNPAFNLSLWESSLRTAWRLLRSAAPRRRGAAPRQHIWMSIGAQYHDAGKKYADAPAAGNCPLQNGNVSGAVAVRPLYVHGVPLVRLMNQIAVKVAREQQRDGLSVDILDQEMLRELAPHDGDGIHCHRGAVCTSTLQYLLQLLELGAQPRD